jgi:putative membrane protein
MRKHLDRILAATGAALILLPSAVLAEATSDTDKYGYGPRMMWWDGGGWYGMIFGPLFMILLLALVIAVAVLLVRWLGGPWQGMPSHHGPPPRTPLDILKERFARGEIDKNEFDDRRRVLGE